MEEKKTKSHGGAAGSASVLTEHCPAPSNMMTEQNVQSLPTDRPRAVGTSQVSIRSSADRLSDFNEARAVWEAAEAKLAYVRAQKALSSGSLTGSVGRRLDDVRSDAGSSGPSRPIREQARDSPFEGIYSPPRTPTPTTTPTPTIYEVFSESKGTDILGQMLSSAASAPSGFQLLSGSGPSVLTEVHLTDGGPPTGSVSSVLTESHLTVGGPRAHGMISELSESYRAVKHDRHGNPVPERAISAAAVYPHPSAVVSVLTEHGTGGGNSAAAQRVAPAAAPLSSLYSGYASADFPVGGVTVGPKPICWCNVWTLADLATRAV
mgnify:FL=1